jgi:monofunctional biosynthetic peptidoglycan transglycosylase
MLALKRWLLLVVLAVVALQLFFALRIVSMNWVAPESTSFQRSQAWLIVMRHGQLPWRQASVDMTALAKTLQRAVIASEDAAFTQHHGIWWQSLEKAWEKTHGPKRRQKDAPSANRTNRWT